MLLLYSQENLFFLNSDDLQANFSLYFPNPTSTLHTLNPSLKGQALANMRPIL